MSAPVARAASQTDPACPVDAVPTGTVQFRDGNTVIAAIPLADDGPDDPLTLDVEENPLFDDGPNSATLITTALPTGTRQITARCQGDDNYKSSITSATPYLVSATPTVTAELPVSVTKGQPAVPFTITTRNPAAGSTVTRSCWVR